MKTLPHRSTVVAFLLAASAVAGCGEDDTLPDRSAPPAAATTAGTEVYPLTIVTRDAAGAPRIIHKTITGIEQERMKRDRSTWLAQRTTAALLPAGPIAPSLLAANEPTNGGDLSGTPIARAAAGNVPVPPAVPPAVASVNSAPANQADAIEVTTSAIRVDSTCAWESLWLFNAPNLTGGQLCVADRGLLDLASLGWSGKVRSLWGASDWGGSLIRRTHPQGACSNTCVGWAVGQLINSVSCSSLFPLVDQGVWGPSCWLPSSSYSNVSDHPSNTGRDWTDQLQGLASDKANYWYITQQSQIRRVPLTRDLNSDLNGYPHFGFNSVESSHGYNHMGDLDYFEGKIYLPLEGGDLGPAISFNNADASMGFINLAPLTGQTFASWCAVNPVDKLLYSSNYNDGTIRKYRRDIVNGQLNLVPVGTLQLKTGNGVYQNLERIQGGAFSSTGKLYLVSWAHDPGKAGIYGFDTELGWQRMFRKVDYEARWAPWPFDDEYTGDELEGIEVLDLDSGLAPGITGQFHVLMVDVDSGTDDVYLKHSRITDVSKL